MDTEVLRYFKVAAQTGNMSRAAAELHISQPTLTVAIKKLEEELQVLLFERSKKGITLTTAGKKVFNQVEELLQSWNTLKREAGNASEEVRGVVRLGVHISVGCYFLPLFMPELLKKNPHLNIQLKHDLSRNVFQHMLNNQIDVGLVMNPENHPDLIIKEVAQDEVTVWRKKSGSVGDTLIYDPSLFQTQWILKQLQKKGHQFPRKIESSSLEVITSLLRAGAGHAILPKRVAQQSSFPMEASFSGLPVYKDSLCLVYRPSFRKTALGRAVIDGITKPLC